MKLLSYIVFIPLQIAMIPFAILGSILTAYKQILVSKRLGVSQTAPYRHFADKNELLAALATRGYRDLLKALRAASADTEDCPRAQLMAFAHAYVDYAATNPKLFKLIPKSHLWSFVCLHLQKGSQENRRKMCCKTQTIHWAMLSLAYSTDDKK